MKLRRAMAVAAATAVIAPAALLAAPAAYAEEKPSASASESASTSATPSTKPSPSTSTSASASTSATPSTSPSKSASEGPSKSPEPSKTAEPSDEPTEPGFCEEDGYESKLDVSMTGLPGKIIVGSGWHKFHLTVSNPSKSTVSDLGYFAAAAADKDGEDIFATKQVVLQAYDEDEGVWFDVNDGEGSTVGFVGTTDELKPGYEAKIPLRINVKASAPVGAGFSLGAGVYLDEEENCVGGQDTAYKFQIVGKGTPVDNTKPQEGGKVPVPTEKPSTVTTPEVTGALAETGSSSMLPTIALMGGVAMVAGAGAIFTVRRRTTAGAGIAA